MSETRLIKEMRRLAHDKPWLVSDIDQDRELATKALAFSFRLDPVANEYGKIAALRIWRGQDPIATVVREIHCGGEVHWGYELHPCRLDGGLDGCVKISTLPELLPIIEALYKLRPPLNRAVYAEPLRTHAEATQ